MRAAETSHRTDKNDYKKIERLIRSATGLNSLEGEKAAKSLLHSRSQAVIPSLIRLLKGKETEPKMAALELLKRFNPHAVDEVIELLREPEPAVRISACEILGAVSHRKALRHLLTCVKDGDPNVRNAACTALGNFQDSTAVEGLLGALDDEEPIAFSAIYSLGKIASRQVIPQLWSVFVDGKGVLPLMACEVLLSFKDHQILNNLFAILKGWTEQRRDIFVRTILEKDDGPTLEQLYEAMGEQLFGHLARFVRSNTRTSIQVMRLLGRFKRQETCDITLDALRKRDADEEGFDELIGLFAELEPVWACKAAEYVSMDPPVLLPFIRACGIARHTLAGEPLDRLFSEAPLDLKREIIRQLPNIIDFRGQASGHLSSEHSEREGKAPTASPVEGATRAPVNEKDGSALLKRALSDEDGHVQGDAALASARLNLNRLVPEILNLARAGYLDVRKKALESLCSLDLTCAAGLVESFVAVGSVEDKKVALTVLEHLDKERCLVAMKRLLSDPDETVVRAAIYTTGKLIEKDDRYLEILGRLFIERPFLHELLRVIRERKLSTFMDRLITLFFDVDRDVWTRYEALAALASFREHSLLNVFINGLRDENTLIKIGSIKALADLRDPSALPHVASFVRSHDAALRSAANAALKQLKQKNRKGRR